MNEDEIRDILKYHVVDRETQDAMAAVRAVITDAAVTVAGMLPPSRERELFITHIQEGQMQAIASLAIHGLPVDTGD